MTGMSDAQIMLSDRAVLAAGEKYGVAVLFRRDAFDTPAMTSEDALESASPCVTATARILGPFASVRSLVLVSLMAGC